MAQKIHSNFLFITCNFGSEKALVHEVTKSNSNLTLGFSKKGFVTFKSRVEIPENFQLELVFGRIQARSLGHFKLIDDQIAELSQFVNSLLKKYPTSLIHVSCRERVDKEKEDENLKKIVEKYQVLFRNHIIHPESIIDLVFIEENEVWVGFRKIFKDDFLLPGNKPDISLPASAPSRAYLKIAEAFLSFQPEILTGETIMEIGSAPGGASFYLLSQGYKVIGVDNAQMDPIVFHDKNFIHLKKNASSVSKKDFSSKVKWLAMDINVKPEIAFMELKKLLPELMDLKGAFLTLKMPKVDGYLEVGEYLKRLSKLGFKNLKAKQLFYNKQEIFIYALK
jgi:23S rRNA (cytidine2498-2'-O)-methyltransferase